MLILICPRKTTIGRELVIVPICAKSPEDAVLVLEAGAMHKTYFNKRSFESMDSIGRSFYDLETWYMHSCDRPISSSISRSLQ